MGTHKQPTRRLIADWAHLLAQGYRIAALDFQRDPSVLHSQVLDACLVMLHRLAEAVATQLPQLWPELRLVTRQAIWHADPNFPWNMAETELRKIETAALSATELVAQADDLEQMVSPENLAKRYGFTSRQKDRLRKQLERWRKPSNCTEWLEVQDRKPRQAGHLYRLGSILPLIEAEKGRD